MRDEIDQSAERKRYAAPKVFTVARKRLLRANRSAMDELVRRYQRAADEKEIAITERQLGEALGVSRMTAYRAIDHLNAKRFISRIKTGCYEEKRKPSLYKLNMFPYRGALPAHEYVPCQASGI